MLTVFIQAGADPQALARTLTSLVGGAIDGVVREVLVLAASAEIDVLAVAEHAGCTILQEEGIAAGLRRAKGDWLLMLEPGASLGQSWTEAVRAHAEAASGPARFSLPRKGRAPFMARLLRRRRPLEAGLVVKKKQALATNAPTATALAQVLRPVRLQAEIIPAQQA